MAASGKPPVLAVTGTVRGRTVAYPLLNDAMLPVGTVARSPAPAPGYWCHGMIGHLGPWPSGRTLCHVRVDQFAGEVCTEGSLVDFSPAVFRPLGTSQVAEAAL